MRIRPKLYAPRFLSREVEDKYESNQILLYIQMKLLHLGDNADIGDEGAAMLLECIGNVENLWLCGCNITSKMKGKLNERGKEVDCIVLV